MKRVRCTICRLKFPNLKTLKSHYLTKHSKIQILRELLKNGIFNVFPKYLIKRKCQKRRKKYKTVFLHDDVQINYNDDAIIIEDTSDDNVIELTFDEANKYTIPILEPCKKAASRNKSKLSKKKKKNNLFHIAIRKLKTHKSLHEHTGEFYECNCMNIKENLSSEVAASMKYSCNSCGTTFLTVSELTDHQNLHSYYCKLCNQVFGAQHHNKDVGPQCLVRIYVCHLCGFEFACKDILIGHLGYHFEQQTFENILNMEQDYNVFGFSNTNFSPDEYFTNISNIILFLTYPYDHFCNRNVLMKVFCDICYQECFAHDYERHLKMVHFLC